MSEQPDGNGKPPSLQQPWWLGKAHRKHIALQFIIICVTDPLMAGRAVTALRMASRIGGGHLAQMAHLRLGLLIARRLDEAVA